MLLTPAHSNTVLPPPLQSFDELLWPILGSQRERQNLAADHFDGKQQAEKRRLDTGKTLSYFEVKPVQPMGGSSQHSTDALGQKLDHSLTNGPGLGRKPEDCQAVIFGNQQ